MASGLQVIPQVLEFRDVAHGLVHTAVVTIKVRVLAKLRAGPQSVLLACRTRSDMQNVDIITILTVVSAHMHL